MAASRDVLAWGLGFATEWDAEDLRATEWTAFHREEFAAPLPVSGDCKEDNEDDAKG